jgi:hypothetical protein
MWSKRNDEKGFVKGLALVGTLAFLSVLAASFFDFSPVAAFNLSMTDGATSARGVDQAASLFGATGIFTTISNVMLFLVGAVSVIMVVVGGLRYVISGGNSASVGAAKNTILYAIVGLVIALLAYAIVNFVIGSFVPSVGGANGTDI